MENHNNYNVVNTPPPAFHHRHNQNQNQNQNPPSSSDEISRFLRQILVPSASDMAQWDPRVPFDTSAAPELLRPQTASFDGMNAGGSYFVRDGAATSSSIGASENNDTDEYDCESEEGLEALVDEQPPKPVLPRSSSKRTRAAEVHNLSEKRRRSRINEKMKALQSLIPNSNKSDKASVLDEAIEYLKQLQLQVQMLTMRNGLNFHPTSLPGVLQPIQLPVARMNFGEENTSPRMNMTGLNQEASSQGVYSLPAQCGALTNPSMPVLPNIIDSGNTFGMESSIPTHFGYQLHSSSQEICRENMPHQPLNINHSEASQSAAVSLPFGSGHNNSGSLEASVIRREQSTSTCSFTKYAAQLHTSEPSNMICNISSMKSGLSETDDDIKVKRPGI